jgi:hypothetical protein
VPLKHAKCGDSRFKWGEDRRLGDRRSYRRELKVIG